MQCNICVGSEGMPQDMEEARQGTKLFGPYTSSDAAKDALHNRGWYERERGRWTKLSSVPGDRSFAIIILVVPTEEVNPVEQLP